MDTKDGARSAVGLMGKLLLFILPLVAVLAWFEVQLARHPEELERERMRRGLDSLARHEGISWFDREDDPDFGPSDFLDMDHLAPQGALRFSRRVDSLLRETAVGR